MRERVGVVLVTYNRKEMLIRTLAHLINQTYPIDTIIIVDNSSNDGTPALLYDKGYIPVNEVDIETGHQYRQSVQTFSGNYTNTIYVRLKDNIGGSGGFNFGLNIAKKMQADWIWIMDDDAFPERNALYELVQGLNDKNIVALSCVVMDKDGKIDLSHRKRINKSLSREFIEVKQSEYEKPYFDYDLFSYVGAFVKREILVQSGLPVKEFFIFYDDTEHSLRMRKYGIIRNINTSFIHHQVQINGKVNNNSDWKKFYQHRNKLLTYYWNFPYYVFVIHLMEEISKCLVSLILFKLNHAKTIYKAIMSFNELKRLRKR